MICYTYCQKPWVSCVVFSNNNKGDTQGRPFAVPDINHTTAKITNLPAGQLKWINLGQVDQILFTVHNKGGEAYKISNGEIVTQMKGLYLNARLLTLYPVLDTLSSALSEMPFCDFA